MTTKFHDSAYRTLALDLLGRSEALQGTAPETLARFVDTGRLARFADANVLAEAGVAVDALVLILRGSVGLGLSTATGKRFVMGYLGPGLILGLIPVLDGDGPIHEARAHGPVVVLQIPKAVFLQAVDDDKGLARALLRMLCKRSRVLHASAAANALAPLRVRVARALLPLLTVHGVSQGETVVIALKLSQEEFASLVGASRQSVNRELKALESAGCISLAYSSIHVTDVAALTALAGIDAESTLAV